MGSYSKQNFADIQKLGKCKEYRNGGDRKDVKSITIMWGEEEKYQLSGK